MFNIITQPHVCEVSSLRESKFEKWTLCHRTVTLSKVKEEEGEKVSADDFTV